MKTQKGQNYVKSDQELEFFIIISMLYKAILFESWRNFKKWQSYSQLFRNGGTDKAILMYRLFEENATQKNKHDSPVTKAKHTNVPSQGKGQGHHMALSRSHSGQEGGHTSCPGSE